MWWVVLTPELLLHREATEFSRYLYGAGKSVNTARAYAGRIARFLSWCDASGVDWRTISLSHLARFKHYLEATPVHGGRGAPSGSTVDGTLLAVCGFLRFCALEHYVEARVAEQLVEPRYLAYMPTGGKDGEFQSRMVRSRVVRADCVDKGIEFLFDDQADEVISKCVNTRETFLVMLLLQSGCRIGEALGLRREDAHFLPDSRSLGCGQPGAHVHFRRRVNPNGMLSKSRRPRSVPVTAETVLAYRDYRAERAAILGEGDLQDMVFVNLYRAPLGAAWKYQPAKDSFDRLARRCGFPLRPHMLRHTAATRWIRSGVGRDVVQELLGHASPLSSQVYVHSDNRQRREAVERVNEERIRRRDSI